MSASTARLIPIDGAEVAKEGFDGKCFYRFIGNVCKTDRVDYVYGVFSGNQAENRNIIKPT